MLALALLNRKGGVGKTTTTRDLAGVYAAGGKRVLLIDLDPQASLTQGLLGPPAAEALPQGATVAALFDDSDPAPASLIRPVLQVDRLSLVAGSPALDPFNLPEPQRAGPYQMAVADFVREVGADFDFVLIDCPPQLYLCSWAALLAVDYVLVPMQPEDYGAQGIARVKAWVDEAWKMNQRLDVLGYLVTMLQPRLAVHQLYLDELRAGYGERVFTNAVPLAADFKAAATARKPVTQYKPKSAAARAMKAVADEVLLRVELRVRSVNVGHLGGATNREAA